MLGVYGHNAIQRPCDAINPKWLRVIRGIRSGKDNAARFDLSIMDPAHRVGHFELKRSVPLLRHRAAYGVR